MRISSMHIFVPIVPLVCVDVVRGVDTALALLLSISDAVVGRDVLFPMMGCTLDT